MVSLAICAVTNDSLCHIEVESAYQTNYSYKQNAKVFVVFPNYQYWLYSFQVLYERIAINEYQLEHFL